MKWFRRKPKPVEWNVIDNPGTPPPPFVLSARDTLWSYDPNLGCPATHKKGFVCTRAVHHPMPHVAEIHGSIGVIGEPIAVWTDS